MGGVKISLKNLVCMRLGVLHREANHITKRRAQLPGTKLVSGESAQEALNRLLSREFPNTDVYGPDLSTEWVDIEPSARHGVITKYVTTEFSMRLPRMEGMQVIGTVNLRSGGGARDAGGL